MPTPSTVAAPRGKETFMNSNSQLLDGDKQPGHVQVHLFPLPLPIDHHNTPQSVLALCRVRRGGRRRAREVVNGELDASKLKCEEEKKRLVTLQSQHASVKERLLRVQAAMFPHNTHTPTDSLVHLKRYVSRAAAFTQATELEGRIEEASRGAEEAQARAAVLQDSAFRSLAQLREKMIETSRAQKEQLMLERQTAAVDELAVACERLQGALTTQHKVMQEVVKPRGTAQRSSRSVSLDPLYFQKLMSLERAHRNQLRFEEECSARDITHHNPSLSMPNETEALLHSRVSILRSNLGEAKSRCDKIREQIDEKKRNVANLKQQQEELLKEDVPRSSDDFTGDSDELLEQLRGQVVSLAEQLSLRPANHSLASHSRVEALSDQVVHLTNEIARTREAHSRFENGSSVEVYHNLEERLASLQVQYEAAQADKAVAEAKVGQHLKEQFERNTTRDMHMADQRALEAEIALLRHSTEEISEELEEFAKEENEFAAQQERHQQELEGRMRRIRETATVTVVPDATAQHEVVVVRSEANGEQVILREQAFPFVPATTPVVFRFRPATVSASTDNTVSGRIARLFAFGRNMAHDAVDAWQHDTPDILPPPPPSSME